MIRTLPLALALGASLAACAPTATRPAAPPAAPPAGCMAAPLGGLIGSEGTVALATTAMAQSGSRTMRWAGPGTALTMDYRPDRLTIVLDEQGRVARFDCG